MTGADVLAIIEPDGRVFASAGTFGEYWEVGKHVFDATASMVQGVSVLPSGAFQISGAPLRLGDHDVGTLVLGTSLDATYARKLSELSHAGLVITVNGAVVARTVPEEVARDLVSDDVEPSDTRTLHGEEFAIRILLASEQVRIYMLTSIDAAGRSATRDALVALAAIAGGSMLLAALGSLWLARMLTRPINRVAGTIATMTAARDFSRRVEPTGTSRELDALTDAFNELMTGLTTAEAETRAAYVGAIRALAAALDARDPYTAGHSERVSAISVLIARHMGLSDGDIDVIRLGALLHDIGKIGVADEILRKPGPLSREEFDQIKRHPGLGAHILRRLPFLAPHLPIVELHHEQPDGKGYPYGLRGDDIPLAARIVHVADTFDAMTSARAYRPPRPRAVALAELQRYSGTQFDPASVEALVEALPDSALVAEPQLEELLGRNVDDVMSATAAIASPATAVSEVERNGVRIPPSCDSWSRARDLEFEARTG
jgi:putative nucleotidyltransferase with HDIG domain